jgi:hypothetical protein
MSCLFTQLSTLNPQLSATQRLVIRVRATAFARRGSANASVWLASASLDSRVGNTYGPRINPQLSTLISQPIASCRLPTKLASMPPRRSKLGVHALALALLYRSDRPAAMSAFCSGQLRSIERCSCGRMEIASCWKPHFHPLSVQSIAKME